MFDAGEAVASRVAGRNAGAGNIDRKPARRGAVIDGIEAQAAIDRVCAKARTNDVVAVAAHDRVGIGRTDDDVGKRRTDDLFDPGQDIAIGIAGAAGGAAMNISSVNLNELMEIVLKRLKPIAQKEYRTAVFEESFRPSRCRN